MVYFLNEIDRKILLNKLLPLARDVGVSTELRGWSWAQEPLKPLYDARLPMYLVCSKYCPTGRDVFLQLVRHQPPKLNRAIGQGKLIHGAVSDSFLAFASGADLRFDRWWSGVRPDEIPMADDQMKSFAATVWDHVTNSCRTEYENHRMQQPFASPKDIMLTSVPFLVEHKITGELLGLSGILSPDCYDYLRKIVFDVKVSEGEPLPWYRLYPTGYALVFESVYEIPVDIGCVVYLSWMNNKPQMRKDLFFINEDLRRWWVEERDSKQEIVAQKKDPGVAANCPETCIYWQACH